MSKISVRGAVYAAVVVVGAMFVGCSPAPSGEEVPSGARKAVEFDGGEVTQGEVEEAVRQQAEASGAPADTELGPGSEQFEAVKAQAAGQLLQTELVRVYAEENGLEANDEQVREVVDEQVEGIKAGVAQQAAGGDPEEAFQEALKANDTTEEKLRGDIEKDVREGDFALARVVQKEVAKVEPPTEREARDFYDENREFQFTQAESRCVRHILFGPDQKKQAEDTKRRLEGDGDFEALAREFSQDPGSAEKGGELGCNPEVNPQTGQPFYVPEFSEAAFGSEQGEVAGPVETEFGFHLIEVTEIQPESETPFEEARPQIEDDLTAQRESEAFQGWLDGETKRRNVRYLPGYDPNAPVEQAPAVPEGEASPTPVTPEGEAAPEGESPEGEAPEE